MRNFIFRCWLSLGDMVLLTAAVRDLHRHYPGRYRTDVRSCFPDLWLNNPHLYPLGEYQAGVKVIDCEMPLVNQSRNAACHAIHGFMDFLNQYLGTHLKPTAFHGDLHLSREEQAASCRVHELAEAAIPFWLISAGGKPDCTIKWWDVRRYQEVVDHFQGRIQFVQVGHAADFHPRLRGVIDLRGRTSVRELMQLAYHAQGVLCGVTGLMHLAAAVPGKDGGHPGRPCVVVAGGREPPHWEAYPGHQFIHTVGTLDCCSDGGCWRMRTLPLGDGDERDGPENLCLQVHQGLPRCMDLITSAEVIRRVEVYFTGGATRFLTRQEHLAALKGIQASDAAEVPPPPLNFFSAPGLADRFIGHCPDYPGGFAGRGIVICGGGARMFTNAWVCIHMLRHLGCTLPIQLWYRGVEEMDDAMRGLISTQGVECVDILDQLRRHPAALDHVWAMKPYALLRCHFQEVLLLDADNVPVANPEYLFEEPEFRRTGAVFWPDFGRLGRDSSAWKLFDVPYQDEPEFETGQVLVDKEKCWRALHLCLWYNERADLYYRHVHGDKETFHLAFRKLDVPYAMPEHPIHPLNGTMCQHDFSGKRLFQHRNLAKWNLNGPNRRIQDFWGEEECRSFLRQLAAKWDGQVEKLRLPKEPPGSALQAGAKIKLFACLVSSPEHAEIHRQTLAGLAATDWGHRPVWLQLHEQRFTRKSDNAAHAAWCAIQTGLRSQAEFILYLEDGLAFNRFFLHNLETWPWLRERQITLASLFNPGFAELGRSRADCGIVVHPSTWLGSQALLLSRSMAEYCLAHWFEGPAAWDMKPGWLAARLERPVVCHWPSLVKPAGKHDSPAGRVDPVRDFKMDWKNPQLNPVPIEVLAEGDREGGHES